MVSTKRDPPGGGRDAVFGVVGLWLGAAAVGLVHRAPTRRCLRRRWQGTRMSQSGPPRHLRHIELVSTRSRWSVAIARDLAGRRFWSRDYGAAAVSPLRRTTFPSDAGGVMALYLGGPELPRPYHFRVRIQSFQAFAAPFPSRLAAPRPRADARARRGAISSGSGAFGLLPFSHRDSIISRLCGAISERTRSASRLAITGGIGSGASGRAASRKPRRPAAANP